MKPPRRKNAKTGFKIGIVARKLGISPSMIRGWERLGLVRPSRTDSRYRIYSSNHLEILRRAVYLRRVVGLNAPAILNQLRQEGLAERRSDGADQLAALGPRLRKMRLQRGESLSTVASSLGVSVGFLSNLERSHSSASVGVLHKVAQYYGVNILDFFGPTEQNGPLVRRPERKVLQGGRGVQMELLAWGRIVMEPHLFRVAPGAGSVESYSHQGEEFLYVTRGRLAIVLGEKQYQLRAGDSFYFESSQPHRWFNPGKSEAVILWINTPPTF